MNIYDSLITKRETFICPSCKKESKVEFWNLVGRCELCGCGNYLECPECLDEFNCHDGTKAEKDLWIEHNGEDTSII